MTDERPLDDGGSLSRWRPRPWPGAHGLHVWRFSPQWLQSLEGLDATLLSGSERARVERLAHPARRAGLIAARSAVRCALASYLDCEPVALQFTQGSHGKPGLSGVHALQFSISHAGGRVLLAVASEAQVGIDLESVRTRPRDDLARRMLGPAALASYAGLPAPARDRAFAWAWAEREAFVKALGLGIGDGWQMVNTLFARLDLPALPQPAASCRSVGGWVLHYLPGWPGFACVVCSGQRAERIEVFDPGPLFGEVHRESVAVATLS